MQREDGLTKGERREKKRNKKKKMIVDGRSIMTLLEVIRKKAQDQQDLIDDSRDVPGG